MKISIFKIKTTIKIILNSVKWFLLDILVLPIFWIIKTFFKIINKK